MHRNTYEAPEETPSDDSVVLPDALDLPPRPADARPLSPDAELTHVEPAHSEPTHAEPAHAEPTGTVSPVSSIPRATVPPTTVPPTVQPPTVPTAALPVAPPVTGGRRDDSVGARRRSWVIGATAAGVILLAGLVAAVVMLIGGGGEPAATADEPMAAATSATSEPSPAASSATPAPTAAGPAPLAFIGLTKNLGPNELGIDVVQSYTLSMTGEPGSTATVAYGWQEVGSVTFAADGSATLDIDRSTLQLIPGNPKIRAEYSDGTEGDPIEVRRNNI